MLYSSFYEDGWFLNFGTSTYLTLFESDFDNITSEVKPRLKTQKHHFL